MATLAQVMDALADQIRSVMVTVTDVDVQVEPRWVVNPTGPCIDIFPGDPSNDPEWRSFHEALGADILTVRARVELNDNYANQDLLLGFMDATGEDPLSLVAAIEEDPTLGGWAQDLDVRNRSGYVRVLESGDMIGCLWTVAVMSGRS